MLRIARASAMDIRIYLSPAAAAWAPSRRPLFGGRVTLPGGGKFLLFLRTVERTTEPDYKQVV
ncbi:MAG: hypothetical protein HPY76_12670 [Anaerolineae bacterium]|nr:hypothetical protein [Anaerolineae bacterium]